MSDQSRNEQSEPQEPREKTPSAPVLPIFFPLPEVSPETLKLLHAARLPRVDPPCVDERFSQTVQAYLDDLREPREEE